MAASLTELFRVLAEFFPNRADLSKAPWEAYVDWAISQGLGPLAAYNLEYRLGACGAPTWAKDRLMALYQGTANDNVMKLVNLKRSLDELEGRKVLLMGGASFAESIYPHVAFRPVIDLHLVVQPGEVEPLCNFLRRAQFRPEPSSPTSKTRMVLTDTRALLVVESELGGGALDEALFNRAQPMKVFGPSIYRLDLEDALLTAALRFKRAGFELPMLEFIDVRELVLGAPSTGGFYSHEPNGEVLLARAKEWGLERALWATLGIVQTLFPETAAACERLKPDLGLAVREVLQRTVVTPVSEVGRTESLKGLDALRQVLT